MNFHSVEGVIGHMRWKRYEEKRRIYQTYIEVHKAGDSSEDQSSINLTPPFESSVCHKLLPSDDTICVL